MFRRMQIILCIHMCTFISAEILANLEADCVPCLELASIGTQTWARKNPLLVQVHANGRRAAHRSHVVLGLGRLTDEPLQ